MSERLRIAVIGAGICGLRVAQRLTVSADVTVFEKSRGLGGRMATRRVDDFHFDHGAQYFTVRDPGFEDFLAPYMRSGFVVRWQPPLATLGGGEVRHWTTPRYASAPGMNGLCKAMGSNLQIERNVRISKLVASADTTWQLNDETGGAWGPFDWVVSTAPAEQAAQLLPESFAHHAAISRTKMEGCYALMLGGLAVDTLDWDAAVVTEGPLAWIALNQSKPGRPAVSSLVCHSQNTWAEAHIDDDPNAVQVVMTEAVSRVTGLAPEMAIYTGLHKWRFAKTASAGTGAPCFVDSAHKLAAAGDWCHGASVEAAFLSAEAASEEIFKAIQVEDP